LSIPAQRHAWQLRHEKPAVTLRSPLVIAVAVVAAHFDADPLVENIAL
jgi:hypothetical protein